ncbi:MAG: hypothetical protein Udaeo2_01670 [Candidatus Udaeobacter sp.]|nr:MAG: hypothetical protein Udaeo2_01670 [Candidatus Udaeobacter sp.]
MGTRIDNRLANFSAELNDRLVHLGLICSLSVTFPPSRISWMCDRSSRVSGSMIANSSSMPRVNVCAALRSSGVDFRQKPRCHRGSSRVPCPPVRRTRRRHFPRAIDAPRFSYLSELAQRSPCHRCLQVFAPVQISRPGLFARFTDCHFEPLRPPIRNLPDRRWPLRIRRGLQNRSRPARRRESQTRPCSSRNQKLVQRQHILLDSLEDFFGACHSV